MQCLKSRVVPVGTARRPGFLPDRPVSIFVAIQRIPHGEGPVGYEEFVKGERNRVRVQVVQAELQENISVKKCDSLCEYILQQEEVL